MSTTRLYIVEDTQDKLEAKRLIEATSPSTAVRHVATRYKASAASAKEVAELMAAGVVVEQVGKEQPE